MFHDSRFTIYALSLNPYPSPSYSQKAMAKERIKIRRWRREDIPALVQVHREIYSDYPEDKLYNKRIFEHQLRQFPEGQFLAEADGRIVGYACSIIVRLDEAADYYTYSEITGAGTFTTHVPGLTFAPAAA